MNNCKSFKPSVDNNSRILVLGSMPGVKSLEEQQYYAHPQNRFWKVMASICNEPKLHEFDYDLKLKTLLKNNIALWDTIKSNGNKSYSAFKKYFPDLLDKYTCYKMPSTSPANARYNLNTLIKEWSIIVLK